MTCTYKFVLPHNFFGVHLVFHMFMLKRYHEDIDYIMKLDSKVLEKDFQYEEETISILGHVVPKWRTKEIKSIKVK